MDERAKQIATAFLTFDPVQRYYLFIVISGLLIFVTAAILIFVLNRSSWLKELQASGIRTKGKVTAHVKVKSTQIAYEFKPANSPSYEGREQITHVAWDSVKGLETGATVDITYSPIDPHHNSLTEYLHDRAQKYRHCAFAVALGLIVVASVILMLWIHLTNNRIIVVP